ncbi:hypothetical protein [Nonomuraea basaltis]|uniref:hypothetical protein n=1 Tax=Nonomuraea basaltis TaxID=2495887 RepID=UPI00110C5EC6|nr:hypothetical protein [Nonomuraea basaltis]TMR98327.1 hypothetical protein EJK15_13340 [Nonomuraea basaltis]
MTGWEAAKQRLYDVFRHVPKPERMNGCPHCVEPDEELCLLAGPVGLVRPEALARYAAKALTTWGGVGEFRYFLPRLLECGATDAFGYPDPEIVFGKLAAAGWQTWPIEERDVIEGFLNEWWHETLRHYPVRPPIDTVICALSATGMDLAPCLSVWSRLDTDALINHLYDFVMTGLSGGRLTNAFWNRRSPAYHQVLTWLTGGTAAVAVEAAFAGHSQEPMLERLASVQPALVPSQGNVDGAP